MHPMKKDSSASQNAKMKRMTEHYGAADPKMNKAAGVDRFTQNGPQDDVGFGADADAPPNRADRKGRVTPTTQLATYKRGGAVKAKGKHAKKRADGGDVSAIEQANRNQALATPSRARGGKVSGKGTHVNIIVAPQGAGQSGNAQPPLPPALASMGAPGGMPPSPPPAAAMPPPRPPMAPPMMPPPGAMPPGIVPPRKRGGRVHDDAKEDMAMIKRVVKPEALKHRARGGAVHMTAGAVTGEGRLQKAADRARRKSGDKSAEI